MVANAAKLANFTGTKSGLHKFADMDEIVPWALDAVKLSVGSKLLIDSTDELRPTENITRGETAVLVLRMLQESGLVDVRATAK